MMESVHFMIVKLLPYIYFPILVGQIFEFSTYEHDIPLTCLLRNRFVVELIQEQKRILQHKNLSLEGNPKAFTDSLKW